MKTILFLFLTAFSLGAETLQPSAKIEGELDFNQLVSGQFSNVQMKFDPKMKTLLSVQKLEKTWKSLTMKYGTFHQILSTTVSEHNSIYLVDFFAEFQNGEMCVRFSLDKEFKICGFFFVPPSHKRDKNQWSPPEYSNPQQFGETDFIIGTGAEALHGTLTLPKGSGPFPVVVLVHGSGPNDRDESVYDNKPFKDLALGLATKGLGVLRYEKRTKEHPESFAKVANATVKEETIDDVIQAISQLRENAAIDSKRFFVLGHSLGGMLLPRIGALDSQIAGLISFAGPSKPLEDHLLEQSIFLRVKGKDLEEVKEVVAKIKNINLNTNTNEIIFHAPVSYWRDLHDYQPAELAKTLTEPMLILQGERDYQVTMEDLNIWKTTLQRRSNVVFKTYPLLNHLFMQGTGPSNSEEYQKPSHVDSTVIADIADWILSK